MDANFIFVLVLVLALCICAVGNSAAQGCPTIEEIRRLSDSDLGVTWTAPNLPHHEYSCQYVLAYRDSNASTSFDAKSVHSNVTTTSVNHSNVSTTFFAKSINATGIDPGKYVTYIHLSGDTTNKEYDFSVEPIDCGVRNVCCTAIPPYHMEFTPGAISLTPPFNFTINNDATVSFSWAPGNLSVRLSCYHTSDDQLLFIEDYHGNTTGATKGGFNPHRNYSCILSFISGYREPHSTAGPPAILPDIRPRQERPGPVTALRTGVLTEHAIAVSWGLPLEPNGAILHYHYSVSGDGSAVVTGDTQSQIVMVDSLGPYVEYTVEVHAVNGGGSGLPHHTSLYTREKAPEAPEITSLERLNVTATVSWSTGNTGGYIIRHTVSLEPLYTADIKCQRIIKEVRDNASTVSTTVDGLDPIVAYEVTIITYNSQEGGATGQPVILEPFLEPESLSNQSGPYVQLKLTGVKGCSSCMENITAEDVMRALSFRLSLVCRVCNYASTTTEWIQNSSLVDSNSGHVIFRAKLQCSSCFFHLNYWTSLPVAFLKLDKQVLLVDSTCPLYVDSLDSPTCSEADTQTTNECPEAEESSVGGAVAGSLLGGLVLGGILATAGLLVYCLLKRARIKREKHMKRATVNTPNKCRYTKPIHTTADDTTYYEPIDWHVKVSTTNEVENGRSQEPGTEAPYAETQFSSNASKGGYANLPIQEPQPASLSQTRSPFPQSSRTAATSARLKNTQPSPAKTQEEAEDDGYEDPRVFVCDTKPNTCPSSAATLGPRAPQVNPLPRPTGNSKANGIPTVAETNATATKPTAPSLQPSVGAKKAVLVATVTGLGSKQLLLPPTSSDRQDGEGLRSGNRKQAKWKLPRTDAPLVADRKQHDQGSAMTACTGVTPGSKPMEDAPIAVLPCDDRGQKPDKKIPLLPPGAKPQPQAQPSPRKEEAGRETKLPTHPPTVKPKPQNKSTGSIPLHQNVAYSRMEHK